MRAHTTPARPESPEWWKRESRLRIPVQEEGPVRTRSGSGIGGGAALVLGPGRARDTVFYRGRYDGLKVSTSCGGLSPFSRAWNCCSASWFSVASRIRKPLFEPLEYMLETMVVTPHCL